MPDFRWIPSVDAIVGQLPPMSLPRPMLIAIIRRELEALRATASPEISVETILRSVADEIHRVERSRIQPVINATGVVLHTNLGRAPMNGAVADAVYRSATQYCSLELDLKTGQRGQRGSYVEAALSQLCAAPSATVVNNCAAALMLIIRRLTSGSKKHVIISRGELVQIGGGFRVPDILHASGAILRAVGTTNQTNLDDYRQAISDDVALILRVHRSNFYMEGFVASPTTADLASVAAEAGVPLVEDIGSGATFDTAVLDPAAAVHEPTPGATLAAGAHLVCFSGDKLLGGPQAGIIAGDASLVAALKCDPVFRALRCDKLVLTALQATVDEILSGRENALASREMLTVLTATLRARARTIVAAMNRADVKIVESVARVGGGALPQVRIDSIALSLPPIASGAKLAARLRENTPPIISKIESDRVLLDLRTIFPAQDAAVAAALRELLKPDSALIA